MMTKPNYTLREKRKRKTRRSLIRAADELFTQQGYRGTTLEEVADRAGVHVQTLYRHFPTKESLVLGRDREAFEMLAADLSNEQRTEDTITLWRRHVERYSAGADPFKVRVSYLKRQARTGEIPELTGSMNRLAAEYREVLTGALVRDLGPQGPPAETDSPHAAWGQ